MALALMIQVVCVFIVPVGAASGTLTITQPDDGEWVSRDSTPKLRWDAVDGAAGYRVSIKRISTGELLVENEWTTRTYYTLAGVLDAPQASYKIWVGAMSSKSDPATAAYPWATITIYTESDPPEIADETWEDTTYDSVTLSMRITKDNGNAIKDSGFYLVESGYPEDESVKYSFKKYGSYSATAKGYKEMTITGLKPSTKYYFRAYAVNSAGETITSRHAVTTDRYECPHTSGVYTNTYPESITYIDTGDAEQHKEIWYFDQYCKYCDEVVKTKAVTETHYGDHEFVADVCKLCKHALACTHKSVSKEYYKTTYTIDNEKTHTKNAFYHPVCDDCGEITDTRTLFDEFRENHIFTDCTCTKCGYIKAEELTLTVTTPETSVYTGSTIPVSASASGGAGAYKYAFSVSKDGKELDATDYSSTTYWSYVTSDTGTYHFMVTCKDGDGTVVTTNSPDITVTSDPSASKEMVITFPSDGAYLSSGESFDITWKKTDGAYGYYVFVKNVTKNSMVVDRAWTFDTSYTVDGASIIPGCDYTIKVSAYAESSTGKLISEKSIIAYTESETMTLRAENASVKSGETAAVKISLANNPGWKSLKFRVGYNEKYFTPKDAARNTQILSESDILWKRTGTGKVTVNCFDTSSYSSVHADNGTLAEISFNVSPNTPAGEYPITITFDSEDVFDGNGGGIALSVVNAVITVEDGGQSETANVGDVNGDGTVNGMDITLIRRFLTGGFAVTGFDKEAADVNHDGVINGMDITLIRRYLAGGYGVTLN